MKKILYIHHAGTLGGAPKSLSILISKLDKNKYKPIVLMIKDGPAKQLFLDAGAEVIIDSRLGAFHGTTVSGMSLKLFIKNLLYLPSSMVFGRRIIKEISPDLIHLNTTCLFVYAMMAKSLNKKTPVICHVREPLLDSLFGKILKRMNYKYADAFIAIEQYDLSKMKTDNKITHVIYNFVDFTIYNKDIKSKVLRNELNIQKEDKIFLYLARVSETNGTLELIKTLNKYDLDESIHFVIAGFNQANPDQYEEKVIIECKKNANVHIMGFRKDVPDIIASSDAIIVPFTEPHFSRTVIEGAAIGVPSIVSNVKGLDELVVNGETGYIYNLLNNDDLINKIKEIAFNDEIRNKFGTSAEVRARQLFDAEINSNRIIEVYEELLR